MLFSDARARYQAEWKPIDDVLYHLVLNHSKHDVYPDVYLKVIFIERLYRAGITRKAGFNAIIGEKNVAEALVAMHPVLSNGLQAIAAAPNDFARFEESIVTHHAVTERLANSLNGTWLTSFVSKYLHFHVPEIPIYDGLVNTRATEYVYGAEFTRAKQQFVGHCDMEKVYAQYVARYAEISAKVKAADPTATAKEIDYLLLTRAAFDDLYAQR